MGIRRALANLMNTALSPLGIAVQNVSRNRAVMDLALRRVVRRTHDIRTVIDIGASDGRWSADFMGYLPGANYLLVEAQPTHNERLASFCQTNRNAQFVLAAAGARQGAIFFDASDPFGGHASLTDFPNALKVPVTTIDHEVRTRRLSGSFLLKFDTHGFEVPIIQGALETLRATEVIIMECYNFKIAPECLLFFEMCHYLADLGFRPIDLVDPMHRPYDDSFWQMDMVFVRQSRPEFNYQSYR